MPSPGNAESWPLCKDASSHPDPVIPLEKSPKTSAQQQLGSIQPGICPRQRWVMCYGGSAQQPRLPELPTSHPPRTARAVGVPADPNCFKLEGRASASTSQLQAGPFPATCWAVNPGSKKTTAQSLLSLPVSSYLDEGHSPPPPCDEDRARWDGAGRAGAGSCPGPHSPLR